MNVTDDKRVQEGIADRINAAHREARVSARKAVEHAINCGTLLAEKKAGIRHGQWEAWVTEHCEFTTNLATRYMKAAKLALTQDLDDEGRLSISREIWGNASHVHRAQGTGENEWYTPPEYIEAACEVMGGIDLDPASTEIANRTVQAESYYTAEDDGLEQEWHGRVWLNPPYSRDLMPAFVDKLITEFVSGRTKQAILLSHNFTETNWFQSLSAVCAAVCLPSHRIKFYRGEEIADPTSGQSFFYLGRRVAGFENVFRELGVIFFPRAPS